jgi:single-strand DNA-binding protein
MSNGNNVNIVGNLTRDPELRFTPSGQKRSKIEIPADEVAPSLRWATVQITRNERRSPDDGPGASNGAGGGGGGYRTVPNETPTPAASYSGGDEEPF